MRPQSHLLSPTTMTHAREYQTLLPHSSHCSRITLDGTCTRLGTTSPSGENSASLEGRLQPWERTPPRPSSASAKCPSSSHQLPVNLVGGHSDNFSKHSLHDCMTRRRSDHGLGRNLRLARAWPRPRLHRQKDARRHQPLRRDS
jgi:hypothetical protein